MKVRFNIKHEEEKFEIESKIPLSVGMVLNFDNCITILNECISPDLRPKLKYQARYIVIKAIYDIHDNSFDCVIEEMYTPSAIVRDRALI
jgi:hypothetical protein